MARYIQAISFYSATSRAKQIVFSRAWQSAGTHVVKLVQFSKSGRNRIDVDAFFVGS